MCDCKSRCRGSAVVVWRVCPGCEWLYWSFLDHFVIGEGALPHRVARAAVPGPAPPPELCGSEKGSRLQLPGIARSFHLSSDLYPLKSVCCFLFPLRRCLMGTQRSLAQLFGECRCHVYWYKRRGHFNQSQGMDPRSSLYLPQKTVKNNAGACTRSWRIHPPDGRRRRCMSSNADGPLTDCFEIRNLVTMFLCDSLGCHPRTLVMLD
jgi:hypothetical protein